MAEHRCAVCNVLLDGEHGDCGGIHNEEEHCTQCYIRALENDIKEARSIADQSQKTLEIVLKVVGEEDCWHEPITFDENPTVIKARKMYDDRSWRESK